MVTNVFPDGRRRTRARLARLVAVPAVAAVAVLVTPGTASAYAPDPVQPQVTCIVPVADGYWTAVFGYTNRTLTVQQEPIGPDNDFDPDKYNGAQPTTFQPGVHQGAISIRVPANERLVKWEIYASSATASRETSPACPAPTQMPAEGNGTGAAIGVVAAGAVGGVVLLRTRRRLERAAVSGPTPAGA
ncbi:hypothetical protein GB931_07305 [Modestobacter sp. I12A-02628]|uniref:LPXTG cell wall anchor domain-containing protein n=1 Tax=Goekera deserti TaxID=2497753 RepID=A0A7K3WHK6_9ACTN|nr:hypothetical protein [Goekera deserti]MPQ97729.1 hypothetical protein [Goekera deserti]NDI48374.1 hypothetical protein [Goekera deserti]NEL55975.1 hypothetical protein [Goekera deserti]